MKRRAFHGGLRRRCYVANVGRSLHRRPSRQKASIAGISRGCNGSSTPLNLLKSSRWPSRARLHRKFADSTWRIDLPIADMIAVQALAREVVDLN